jgi:predicted lipoprotein with Yx(FWY)xxD motif
MFRSRSISTFLVGGTAIAALALSACGSDNNNSSKSANTTTTQAKSASAATVVVDTTDLGKVLADSKDRTLYLFMKDSGTTSECNDACATAWPPLTVSGTPTAASGAEASLVGMTTRADGTTQVTYNGHPVYRFSGDQSAGQTAGQGLTAFGGSWYAVSPTGEQVTGTASSSGSSGTSSGGSGY